MTGVDDQPELARQVALLKTIADETRLRILGLLAEAPRGGRELAAALDLSAPTVSHHVKRLEEAGVITVEVSGASRTYRPNQALLADVQGGATVAPVDDPYYARTVRTFFDGPRLRSIPAKRRPRVVVLLELLRRFTPGRTYTEQEVNEVLARAHDDVAFLRRELVDYRYLARESGRYWVVAEPPQRDANEAQEVPPGEADWLRRLLQSTLGRPHD